MTPKRPRIIVLAGPTAAGKTGLALQAAEELGGEIISADAVAVYRGLDIGAAKPTPEERQRIRHHLIDVVDPDEEFNAARFSELARAAASDILGRGRQVIVAGGTGLYIRSMLHGLFDAPAVDPKLREELKEQAISDPEAAHRRLAEVDPKTAEQLHPQDWVRITRALEVYLQTGQPISTLMEAHGFKEEPYHALTFGLSVDRAELARLIEIRTRRMFEQGLIEEVEGLLSQGLDPGVKALQTIGYKQTVAYLQGRLSRQEALEQIVRDTKRLAKRQMTWFRADKKIKWLQADNRSAFVEAARLFLDTGQEPDLPDRP